MEINLVVKNVVPIVIRPIEEEDNISITYD